MHQEGGVAAAGFGLEWLGARSGQLALSAASRSAAYRSVTAENQVGVRLPGRFELRPAGCDRRSSFRQRRVGHGFFFESQNRMHLLDVLWKTGMARTFA